jgi:hypothetical protein
MADVRFASWFGADNYNDCVLDAVKNSSNNNLALRLAERACRSKFPDTAPQQASPPKEDNRVTCGSLKIDPHETQPSGVSFKNPTNNFFADVKKVKVDGVSGQLVIYAQHNWPFPIWELVVGARKTRDGKGVPDWTYQCTGVADSNVTGAFYCGEDNTKGEYWYRIESIVTQPELKKIDLFRANGDC